MPDISQITQEVEEILTSGAYATVDEDAKAQARSTLIAQLYTARLDDERKREAEAARRQTLPRPPQPTPTDVAQQIANTLNNQLQMSAPTITMPSNTLTLNQLRIGLPLRTQKEITQSFQPLAQNSQLPAQQDLSQFFERAERIINGISTDFTVDDLQEDHIAHFGPLLLGQSTWDTVRNLRNRNWYDFKKNIQTKYGLSQAQIREAFYNMKLARHEDPNQFILRVDNKRQRYNFDKETCFLVFRKQLPIHYCAKLDEVKEMMVTMSEEAEDFELDWDALVRRAQHATKGTKYAPTPDHKGVRGFDAPVGEQLPAPEVPANVLSDPAHAVCAFGSYETCTLCKELGKEVAINHDVQDCWANPYSKRYRKGTYDQRLLECLRAGRAVPELMKVYQEKSLNTPAKPAEPTRPEPTKERLPGPPPRPTHYTMDQINQFTDDLSAYLGQENRDVGEAIAEALAANFGLEVEDQPDPCPSFMLGHLEEEEATLTAVTHQARQSNLQILKKYVGELAKCSDEDLLAALEGVEEDVEMPDEEGEQDSENDPEEDTSAAPSEADDGESQSDEDTTLQELAKKLKQRALKTKMHKATATPKYLAKPKPPQEQTTGQRLGKLKFVIPLLQAITLKKNMRGLLLNYAIEQVNEKGETLKVPHGTRVKEVNRTRFMQERQAYQEAPLDDEAAFAKKLKQITLDAKKQGAKRKGPQALVMDHIDSIVDALTALVEEDDLVATSLVEAQGSAPPTDPLTPPTWAQGKYQTDCLGLVRHTRAHYIGHIVINSHLIEALFDTCGAKSMIDRATAAALGLEIEVATRDRHFGSFYGPGEDGGKSRSVYYYGRIKGPMQIMVGPNLYLTAEEFKVVEHFEPLVLIGTDILIDTPNETKFCYVGLHPDTRKGNLVLKDSSGKLHEILMASWPHSGRVAKAPQPQAAKNKNPVSKALLKNAKAKRDRQAAKERKPQPMSATTLLALMQGQSQRL